MNSHASKAAPTATHDSGLRRSKQPAEPGGHESLRHRDIRALQVSAGNRAVSQLLGGGVPLAGGLRTDLEARFGTDFGDVRIHDDSQAHDSAAALGAKAYTHANHIVFSEERYAPHTAEGRLLLAHELAHVVQQRRGGTAPELDPGAAHEQGAHAAAEAAAGSTGPVTVSGATAVGIACEKDDEEKKKNSQASLTVLTQKPKKIGQEKSIKVVTTPNQARGILGEVTVPFALYSEPDWSNFAGGSETESSRINLARPSSKDKAAGREGTAGFDFLARNRKTDRLVIGEQKATKSAGFHKATAITTYLKTNLTHTIGVLRNTLDSGRISDPAEMEHTIAKLEATHKALVNQTELPPGVVFELTSIGGASERIGKDYIDLFPESYRKNPAFLEHLLGRTFVRDPALARAKDRDSKGQRGTDADPEIVPANDLLTPDAHDELARLRSGKSEAQWEENQAAAKKQRKDADKAARVAERKAERDKRAAAQKKAREEAKERARQAREQRLKQLQDEQAGKPEPSTKRERKKQESQRKRDAEKVGKEAEKKHFEDYKARVKQEDADKRAKRDAEEAARQAALEKQREARAKEQADIKAREQELAKARETVQNLPDMTPEDWNKLPPETRKPLEKLASQNQSLDALIADKTGSNKISDQIKTSNEELPARNRRARSEEKMSSAAHRFNQAAAAVRGVDAFLGAIDQKKGLGEATFEAGKTYLENTNLLLGALATFESRMQTETLPDGRKQQVYGEDAGDAFFGTLGETIGGFIVPGKSADQLVNAGANLTGAVDDHLNRDRNPAAAGQDKASLRTVTDLAAEMTPSRMFSQTIGASMRAYYDIGKVMGGQTSGVDKFAEDGLKGKLGAVIQPWAMLADFAGNLGGNDAGTALDKTLAKTKGSTLQKLGDASGDAMYNLGQSKEAKEGLYGPGAQAASVFLGVTSGMIAGDNFEQAMDKNLEATKGSLTGEVASAAWRTGKELVKEDIPAAKKYVSEKIGTVGNALGEARKDLGRWWDSL